MHISNKHKNAPKYDAILWGKKWQYQWVSFARYCRLSLFLQCFYPMPFMWKKKEQVMRKRGNPLANVCCIPCWRREKMDWKINLRFRKSHWFLLWKWSFFPPFFLCPLVCGCMAAYKTTHQQTERAPGSASNALWTEIDGDS